MLYDLKNNVCPSYGDLRKKTLSKFLQPVSDYYSFLSDDAVVNTSPGSDLSHLHTPFSSSSFKHKATYYRSVNKVRKALPKSPGKRQSLVPHFPSF